MVRADTTTRNSTKITYAMCWAPAHDEVRASARSEDARLSSVASTCHGDDDQSDTNTGEEGSEGCLGPGRVAAARAEPVVGEPCANAYEEGRQHALRQERGEAVHLHLLCALHG